MKNSHFAGLLVLVGVMALSGMALEAAACTPTGFYRDGFNMTAFLINPAGPLTGEIDASGCNIGVYYDNTGSGGSVEGANIHGANYYGIVINGDNGDVTVDVLNSSIHDIGETPLNGAQHGVAVYYRAFGVGSTTGQIVGNSIFHYQKGGVVTNGGGTQVTITDNTVTGEGPVNYIAQNGIQVGYGATASVMRNAVSGHSYTGANLASSGGILVVGGAGYGNCIGTSPCPYTVNTRIMKNLMVNNDVGVFLSNLDGNFDPPATATNIKVVNNTITNDAITNTTGNTTGPYQAGVSDVGNNDKVINNDISGLGYAPSSCTVCVPIDVTFTNRPKVHANK